MQIIVNAKATRDSLEIILQSSVEEKRIFTNDSLITQNYFYHLANTR